MSGSRLVADPGIPVSNPTKSYWQIPPHEKLLNIQSSTLPKERDVVVIGSGITGCTVSWWLLKDNPNIALTVLDAREICSGATGRNGGRINCTAVQDYNKYRSLFGDETAKTIVRFELQHLDALDSFLQEAGSSIYQQSEFRRVNAVTALFDESSVEKMSTNFKNFELAFPDLKGQWKMIGQAEVVKTHGITNARGALVGRAGAAWPYRMITAIFHHLLSQHEDRFSLEANTAATKITKTPDSKFPYSIMTPRGVIKAKHVVHCAEGHSGHLLPRVRGLLVPRRGQITVQNPGSGFPAASSNSWSFIVNNGLDYATQNPSSGQIFIGGGDADKRPLLGISSDAEEDIEALSHLGGILPAVFGVDQWGHEVGNKKRIEASWTGILCNSIDSVPFVGMLPQCLLDRPAGTQELGAEWICAGYGGYGMVNAFVSAKSLARMIQGTDVRGHLPAPYILTGQRAERLLLALQNVLNSEKDHLKALL